MIRVSIFLIAVAFLITVALIAGMAGYVARHPIEIWDWYDLNAIRDNLGGRHHLMNDLDSTTAGYEELASSTANEGKGWEPIGTALFDQFDDDEPYDQSDPFTGTFEGQGYEIRDLFINRPDEEYVGLFGNVDDPHVAAPTEGDVVCLNLWKNPTTVVEALSVAHSLNNASPPDIATGQGAHEVMLGDVKFGEAVTIPWVNIRDSSWMPPCAFAQSDLLRVANHLVKGDLYLLGAGTTGKVMLCPLQQLGSLGPDARDIHDGFGLAQGRYRLSSAMEPRRFLYN